MPSTTRTQVRAQSSRQDTVRTTITATETAAADTTSRAADRHAPPYSRPQVSVGAHAPGYRLVPPNGASVRATHAVPDEFDAQHWFRVLVPMLGVLPVVTDDGAVGWGLLARCDSTAQPYFIATCEFDDALLLGLVHNRFDDLDVVHTDYEERAPKCGGDGLPAAAAPVRGPLVHYFQSNAPAAAFAEHADRTAVARHHLCRAVLELCRRVFERLHAEHDVADAPHWAAVERTFARYVPDAVDEHTRAQLVAGARRPPPAAATTAPTKNADATSTTVAAAAATTTTTRRRPTPPSRRAAPTIADMRRRFGVDEHGRACVHLPRAAAADPPPPKEHFLRAARNAEVFTGARGPSAGVRAHFAEDPRVEYRRTCDALGNWCRVACIPAAGFQLRMRANWLCRAAHATALDAEVERIAPLVRDHFQDLLVEVHPAEVLAAQLADLCAGAVFAVYQHDYGDPMGARPPPHPKSMNVTWAAVGEQRVRFTFRDDPLRPWAVKRWAARDEPAADWINDARADLPDGLRVRTRISSVDFGNATTQRGALSLEAFAFVHALPRAAAATLNVCSRAGRLVVPPLTLSNGHGAVRLESYAARKPAGLFFVYELPQRAFYQQMFVPPRAVDPRCVQRAHMFEAIVRRAAPDIAGVHYVERATPDLAGEVRAALVAAAGAADTLRPAVLIGTSGCFWLAERTRRAPPPPPSEAPQRRQLPRRHAHQSRPSTAAAPAHTAMGSTLLSGRPNNDDDDDDDQKEVFERRFIDVPLPSGATVTVHDALLASRGVIHCAASDFRRLALLIHLVAR